jgi:NAD(P)-dependent dehydrogenase (short-subunit alcohol dehydrogenase family)
MIDYSNSTILVTGAASGIGEALAIGFAERGAQVICADVNIQGAEQTATRIGRSALAIECDLADPNAAAALVERSHAVADRLNLICSNAGIGHRGRVTHQDMNTSAAVSRLFEINFFAGLKIAQAYVQLLEHTGQTGRLLVTASENSLSVPDAVKKARMGFYGATKHALLVALEWMRIDLQGGPLDLHVLLPGVVYTPLIAKSLPDPALAPPALELISAARCAELALRGIDKNLFYIPTQPHLLEDMQPRLEAIAHSLTVLGIAKPS